MKRFVFILAVMLASVTTVQAISTKDMVRHDASTLPVLGTAAPDAAKRYSRLPDSLKSQLRPDMWGLGLHSAGMALRFASDATDIGAAWDALNTFNMNHMTPTGIRGLDLYVLTADSSWTTVSSARPALRKKHTEATIATGMPRKMREYMLYLPLYDGVDSIYILTDSAARVAPPSIDLPRRELPVVMYGSSILQGGCASRPGMVHTSILGRMLNREVYNLGFSGNARLDSAMARFMADIPSSLIVIDALPNCKVEQIVERAEPFVSIIRAKQPDTPILLVESPMFPISRHSPEVAATLTEKNKALRAAYDRLVAAGDKNLYYFTSDLTLTDPEATVDNYHYTDKGFMDFAQQLYPIVSRLIAR